MFSLRAANGCLVYEHAAFRFLFLPVPPVLAPRVRARVSPDPEGWHVDVGRSDHGFPAWVLAGLAVGVLLSGVRDVMASVRLARQ